jgi:hypothetical protein
MYTLNIINTIHPSHEVCTSTQRVLHGNPKWEKTIE